MPSNVAVAVPPPLGDACTGAWEALQPFVSLHPARRVSREWPFRRPWHAGSPTRHARRMTLRMCLLVAGAGALLNQAALGCRHHRPSLDEMLPRPDAAASPGRSVDLSQTAACAQETRRPAPSAME